MFAEEYKKAYDSLSPSLELQQKVVMRAGRFFDENDSRQRKMSGGQKENGMGSNVLRVKSMVRVAAAAAIVGVGVFKVMPVGAMNIPAFYRVIEYISPALAERLVPVEKSCSSQGITMEVEAVDLREKEAEIIVSVRDDEGSSSDRIHGQIDLFDSYGLLSYGSNIVIGGCSFLNYDEETDKAYFKITTQVDGQYQADKLRFTVREILCEKDSERREIALKNMMESVAAKVVEINGMGGWLEEQELPEGLKMAGETSGSSQWCGEVLDLSNGAECAADGFTVVGGSYADGVLRLQICMGDNRHADRHVEPFLVDAAGKERREDYSVSWQETVGDISYQFYEYWFIGEIVDPADYSMYGIFHNSAESIEGDWEVIFRIE